MFSLDMYLLDMYLFFSLVRIGIYPRKKGEIRALQYTYSLSSQFKYLSHLSKGKRNLWIISTTQP